ncbi:MAG: alkaline phosphatase D family protein [Gemmataceae bacterium]|nr:alkaline phosphatase D family protein [Gemmataceae bacterium]
MAIPFDLRAAARSEGGVSRRLFLAAGAALAGLPRLAVTAAAADRKVSFPADPFTLGVASGDPDATSVVLWTRLAPKPLDPDGGLKPEVIPVAWEVADDEGMTKVVASGTAAATPQLGHSVHAEAKGLAPDRWYFYRFRAGDAVSPVGRTRTLPAADASPDKLRFAFASCQHYEHGLFTAYEHMAKDDLDLVVHLGDYIYEYPHRENAKQKLVRKHAGPTDGKIKTLDDYRNRHAQYRADPLLHRMHARCPWLVTWDDHEFDNNYANDVQEEQPKGKPQADPVAFLEQRAAAYQAYYEFMPLRPRSLPRGPDLRLYRKASFGRLAELLVLDTRQYRTDQPNGDRLSPLDPDALNPKNTLLGRDQRGWLEASLLTSPATWNVLAQQVMMAMVEVNYGGRSGYSMDQWPGYAHERMALAEFLRTRRVPNPVVLTGDIHSNWVNDLRVDDRKAEAPVVATEFVGTSISTGGNGAKEPKGVDALLAANPAVKFHNRERGYVRCSVTPTSWTTDYVVVEDVTAPGAAALTRASFAVEAGKPGAVRA